MLAMMLFYFPAKHVRAFQDKRPNRSAIFRGSPRASAVIPALVSRDRSAVAAVTAVAGADARTVVAIAAEGATADAGASNAGPAVAAINRIVGITATAIPAIRAVRN
jgi:hypothetical protein